MKNMNVMSRLLGISITFSRIEIRPACTVKMGCCVVYCQTDVGVYLTVTAEDITNTSVVPPTASDSSLGAGHPEWHAENHSSWSSSPPTRNPEILGCFTMEPLYLSWL